MDTLTQALGNCDEHFTPCSDILFTKQFISKMICTLLKRQITSVAADRLAVSIFLFLQFK